MKIMRVCLLIVALLKVTGISAMVCDQIRNTLYDSGLGCDQSNIFYDSNRGYQFVKLSPLLGGMLSVATPAYMLCLNYCARDSVFGTLAFGFGGAFVGLVAGFGVAYVGIKTYKSCVLRLQHRQNSDVDYQPVSA